MIALIGNTHVHRVGDVLDQRPGATISASSALAVFHIAEHILFADQIAVSNFELSKTNDRTLQVLTVFAEHGVTHGDDEDDIFKIEPFTTDEYGAACREAVSGICEDLALLTPTELTLNGRLADERTRPDGVQVPLFNSWISDQADTPLDDEKRSELVENRAHGAFELITRESSPVRNAIRSLCNKKGRLTKAQLAALSVIFRLNINQQLASQLSGVYSPAPQRAKVAMRSERLFRHRLERIVQDLVGSKKEKATPELLLRLMDLQTLPLPLFAIRLLADTKARTPRDLIECARNLRDTKSVIAVRHWLQEWEDKLRTTDKSWSAITELSKWRADLVKMIECNEDSLLSLLRPEIKVEAGAQFGSQSISFSLLSAKDAVSLISRRVGNQRIFIATTARRILSDADLGKKMIAKLGMSIRLD